MYIIYKNNAFCISSAPSADAVCEIFAPVCIENKSETAIPLYDTNGNVATYKNEENEVKLTVEKVDDTLFYLHRVWKNTSGKARTLRIAQRIRPIFDVGRYLIPCVSINGNEFGAGFEPKGLERDGERWVFGYDRVSIPSCTLTENSDFACALFASAENALSLESACSIYKDEQGRFVQELSHPVAELPITYSSRDKYSEGYERFLTLAPDETVEFGAYLSVSKPRWENYGICNVLDSALELYGNNDNIESPTNKQLWDR
jgi:hypothetical protein